MTYDDKKADIFDGASNLCRHGLPSLRVSSPEWTNVNNGNIKQHCRLRSGEDASDCMQRCRRSTIRGPRRAVGWDWAHQATVRSESEKSGGQPSIVDALDSPS
jgi:hypothetical protein